MGTASVCRRSRVIRLHKRHAMRMFKPFFCSNRPTGVWINNVKVDVHRSELLRRNDIISFCDPACAPEKSIKYKFKVPPRSLVTLKERSIEDMYCRRDLIGNGAFGAVSYVQCLRTGKKFALKRARLMRENDIKLERAVVFDDTFYLVMELGGDGDLFKLISGTPLAEDEIRIIFDQIAHALAFLHDQEITHRDLKLENVMVADRNKLFVKLGDFGFSRFSSTNSPLTTRCGTPFYCAPELLPADGPLGYTKAVDIWALGVMLYSVFTMSMPFAGKSILETDPKLRWLLNVTNGHSLVDNPDSKEGKSELDEMIRSSEPFYDPRVWRKISPEGKYISSNCLLFHR
ncbi:kinase-like domain-containing protein [Dichotomocladium elegans]|nr:kinase-like domain-containing protein [Dichotomocladium elegans]